LSHAGAVLAFLALALQLLVPAGFMPDTRSSARGIAIVICTGQGPLTINWDGHGEHGSKHTPAKPMAACPFASHVTAATLEIPSILPERVVFTHASNTARAYTVYPGRGLAAPPPPAIGPPSVI